MVQHDGEYQSTPAPSYLFEEHANSSFFLWWYHLTSLPAPNAHALPLAWTQFRSAHSTSRVLLILALLALISLPVLFLHPTLVICILLMTTLLMLFIAALNQIGQTTLAGLCILALLEGELFGSILLFPPASGSTSVPPLHLLILPLLLASLLLPIWFWYVLGLALLNALFTLYILLIERHAPLALVSSPLLLQGLVSLAAFLWVQETARAMARAERAEAIARLEHDIATHWHIIAEQKQQLEAELQHIIDTHMRVANGDLSARVPFDETQVLWQLATGRITQHVAHTLSAREIRRGGVPAYTRGASLSRKANIHETLIFASCPPS